MVVHQMHLLHLLNEKLKIVYCYGYDSDKIDFIYIYFGYYSVHCDCDGYKDQSDR